MLTEQIELEDARHVLFHFGRPGGYQAGSFTTHLLHALSSADPAHFARLAAAYPSLAAAVDLAQNDQDGIAKLQHIAAGDR